MHEGSSQQSSAAPPNADFSLHSPGQHLHPAAQMLMLYALTQKHGIKMAYLLPCLPLSKHCIIQLYLSEGLQQQSTRLCTNVSHKVTNVNGSV